ncbi:hypothetical protein K2X33_04060 [bacterium]|nr:hypothetical protein [bacterium]
MRRVFLGLLVCLSSFAQQPRQAAKDPAVVESFRIELPNIEKVTATFDDNRDLFFRVFLSGGRLPLTWQGKTLLDPNLRVEAIECDENGKAVKADAKPYASDRIELAVLNRLETNLYAYDKDIPKQNQFCVRLVLIRQGGARIEGPLVKAETLK